MINKLQNTQTMAQKETKIYLNYLNKDEKVIMTRTLAFLLNNDDASKAELIKMAGKLYGKENRLNFLWDNGHMPSQWQASTRSKDKHFYTIIQFEKKHLTEQALEVLGTEHFKEFPYYYGISICDEDRKMYVVSFKDDGVPNWNNYYIAERYRELQDVDFTLLKEDGIIYKMDDALHAAINNKLASSRPMFTEKDGHVTMTVRDQHGNYCDIEGSSLEEVFRNYADNYTGYRDYRRQMASEWEIADDGIRQKYEEWKQTAKGLKSSFDKFYGGGIVD